MFTNTELYQFQEEAVERMLEQRKILVAYDMGLGKTVITIAAIEALIESGDASTGLIVTPASLKYQWKRMIKKFTDGAPVLVVDGSPADRKQQYGRARDGRYDYIILNYEQVVRDWGLVVKLPRDFVVCDEVTAIKSFRAKRARSVKKLQAPYLFGLTGQPIENRAEELYSIMQWIDAKVLGRFDIFDRTFIVRNTFGGVRRYKNLPMLHKRVAEAMVRKTREDVSDQLPAVSEETILIEFDPAGARLYRTIVDDLLTELQKAVANYGSSFDLYGHYHGDSEEVQARGRIMSRLTCLRMLCDNPRLLKDSAEAFGNEKNKTGSAYAAELEDEGRLDAKFQVPKLATALDLIEEILTASDRNKIVLFSFFKGNLRELSERLKVGNVFFTGDMSPKARDKAKQTFTDDPDCRVFLSSDAGGYGVDLPNANFLVNYNLPWSAGKLDQRNARIVRLSSEFDNITVVNLLMLGSIEERYQDVLEQKRKVASAIVDGKGADQRGGLNLDLTTLTKFLEESSV